MLHSLHSTLEVVVFSTEWMKLTLSVHSNQNETNPTHLESIIFHINIDKNPDSTRAKTKTMTKTRTIVTARPGQDYDQDQPQWWTIGVLRGAVKPN